MNIMTGKTLAAANAEAIYNVYIYLADKTTPAYLDTLRAITEALATARLTQADWTAREINRLNILRAAIEQDESLANSRIINLTRSNGGLTAGAFIKPNSGVSVVYRGTGSGEWLDNGEGLSGIPEENTYMTYGSGGKIVSRSYIREDHATDQQVEALNWFNYIATKNGWTENTDITVSGHSKGGNKAQFVALNTDLADTCYSFDGQGFSPEALASFKTRHGEKYDERRQKIKSISADNDYVNVLGERLMPAENIFYFRSQMGLHNIEAILEEDGQFRAPSEQGRLSRYVETVSAELMMLPPSTRKYATLGIMNLFQKHLGKGIPVNGDTVSLEETIAGIAISLGPILHQFRNK